MTAPGRTPGPRWVRWIPWVLLGAVAVGILLVGTHRDRGHPTVAAETLHIAAMVRCPVCEGQSAAQSDAPASVQIRAQIQRELQAGEHQGQILSGLVAAYGPGILEQPEARGVDLIVWVVPVIAVVLAIAGLALAFARWRARPSLTVSDDDRALVEAALNPGTMSTASDEMPPGSPRPGDSGGQHG